MVAIPLLSILPKKIIGFISFSVVERNKQTVLLMLLA
jgi:hypothetical protein